MIQAKIFRDMAACKPAMHLILNAMSVGETNSGGDLSRVADLIPDADLKRRVQRHYADEMRHGKVFGKRLEELGGQITPLPPELDYEVALHRHKFGLLKERLTDDRPLDDQDLIKFFAGAKVTEATAISDLKTSLEGFRSTDAETARVLEDVLQDEYRHVEYATEELAKLAGRGHEAEINAYLKELEATENLARREISEAFMARMLPLLGYGIFMSALIRFGVQFEYWVRRLFPNKYEVRAAAAVAAPAAPAPTPAQHLHA